MSQRKIRCTAVALALAAVLTLAAPVRAANHPRMIPSSGWLEAVWQWVGGIWGGGAASTGTPAHHQKAAQGPVVAPGSDSTATATTNPGGDKGGGVDPNG